MKVMQLLYSGLGGHGSVVFSMIAADHDRLFEHQLLFYGIEEVKQDYLEKCEHLGIEQRYVPKKSSINSWFKIYRALKKMKPDVLLVHATTTIFPCKFYAFLAGKKIIVVDHQANEKKRMQDWIFAFFNSVLANYYVVLTKHSSKGILKKIPYIKSKLRTIPNGIDTSLYKPIAVEGNSRKIISMVARMNALRDFETLISAFDELATEHLQIELHLAGDGPDFGKVQAAKNKAQHSDRILLLGSLAESEIVQLLQQTYIYVHSSLADNMSTAVMQAMSCGLPIIVTDIEALHLLIDKDENGLFFEVKNKEQLCLNLLRLLNESSLAKELGKAARKKAEQQFSQEDMFLQYKNLIESK